jgi:hypothetical protein
MSEYRDELESAHQRIAQLEEALRGRPLPPPRSASPLIVAGMVMGVVMTCVIGAGLSLLIAMRGSERPEEPPIVEPTPVAAVPQRLYASWYPQYDVAPTVVDVDGDGQKDLVGLFWKGSEDHALWAAALDGKTFALKWAAGPFPSQWASDHTHLVVSGDSVVISDTQNHVRVLSLAKGEVKQDVVAEHGVNALCVDGDKIVAELDLPLTPGSTEPRGRIVDVKQGMLTTAVALPATCGRGRYDSCDPQKPEPGCQQWGRPTGMPRDASAPKLDIARAYFDGATRVAIGETPAQGEYLVGFTQGAKAIAWKQPVVVEGDAIHFGGVHYALHGGRMFGLYQTTQGPYRLVVRDAATGELVASPAVPNTHEGSHLTTFRVTDDYVFVVTGQTVHVFDPKTGAYLQGLDNSTT